MMYHRVFDPKVAVNEAMPRKKATSFSLLRIIDGHRIKMALMKAIPNPPHQFCTNARLFRSQLYCKMISQCTVKVVPPLTWQQHILRSNMSMLQVLFLHPLLNRSFLRCVILSFIVLLTIDELAGLN